MSEQLELINSMFKVMETRRNKERPRPLPCHRPGTGAVAAHRAGIAATSLLA